MQFNKETIYLQTKTSINTESFIFYSRRQPINPTLILVMKPPSRRAATAKNYNSIYLTQMTENRDSEKEHQIF